MANPSFYVNPTQIFFLSETIEESGFLIMKDSNSLIWTETCITGTFSAPENVKQFMANYVEWPTVLNLISPFQPQ